MLTAEQRQVRKSFLGASDVAAILGLDEFRSGADVYLSKTADMVDDVGDPAALGNHFERPILQWAEKTLGPLAYDIPTVFAANGVMCANLDALEPIKGRPVEAKMSGINDEWGDSGTDNVPKKYLVQVHAQMLCNGGDVAYLAALLTGVRSIRESVRLYEIPRNEELLKAIEDECLEWWDKHIVAGVMPDSAPSMETVRKIRRQPGKVVPLDPAIAAEYIAAKQGTKAAKDLEDDARARLEAALAGADAGECPGYTVEFKDVNVKEYTVAARTDRRLTCKAAK